MTIGRRHLWRARPEALERLGRALGLRGCARHHRCRGRLVESIVRALQ